MWREDLIPVAVRPADRIDRAPSYADGRIVVDGRFRCGNCRSQIPTMMLVECGVIDDRLRMPMQRRVIERFAEHRPLAPEESAVDVYCPHCTYPTRLITRIDAHPLSGDEVVTVVEIIELAQGSVLFAEEIPIDEVDSDEEVAAMTAAAIDESYDDADDEDDHVDDDDGRPLVAAEHWPELTRDRMLALRSTLRTAPYGLTTEEIARRYPGASADAVAELLDALAILGAVRIVHVVDGDRKWMAC